MKTQPGENLGEWFKPLCKVAMTRFNLNAQDAEDAVQECMIMMWKEEKKTGIVNRDKPLMWRRLSQSVYYHLKRMIGHKDQVPTKYAFYTAEHVIWDSLDDVMAPRSQSAENEVMGKILDEKYDAYWDLSPKQKALLGLVQVGFYPVEVGERIGASKNQMHNRMETIRKQMRRTR